MGGGGERRGVWVSFEGWHLAFRTNSHVKCTSVNWIFCSASRFVLLSRLHNFFFCIFIDLRLSLSFGLCLRLLCSLWITSGHSYYLRYIYSVMTQCWSRGYLAEERRAVVKAGQLEMISTITTYHKYHKLTCDFLREEHAPIVNLDCSATPDGVWEQVKAVGRLMRIPVGSSRSSSL